MDTFSQMEQEEQEVEVFDYCDKFEKEIYVNQRAWKAGDELFCDWGCLVKGLNLDYTRIRTKRK
ncbi:hypothetical protein ACEU2D_15780 [Brevibacillus laterosporus]|uniref:hypothetical protein n=1 Tax=Brevibacillus laterosporus TaxID=1465 RepID=UPI0035A5D6B3